MADYERREAVVCSISDINSGSYYRMPGWDPNFVLIGKRIKASRVNVLGVITTKNNEGSSTSLSLDDGTGTIMLRSFEEQNFDVNPGDAALIVGRPRDFSGNLYIVPEIVRRIENMKWVDYRQKELELLQNEREKLEPVQIDEQAVLADSSEDNNTISSTVAETDNNENKTEENTIIEKPAEKKPKSDTESIYDMIQELDSGDGAEISTILEEADKKGIQNAEKALKMMLEIGDIFEIKAGKVKVL